MDQVNAVPNDDMDVPESQDQPQDVGAEEVEQSANGAAATESGPADGAKGAEPADDEQGAEPGDSEAEPAEGSDSPDEDPIASVEGDDAGDADDAVDAGDGEDAEAAEPRSMEELVAEAEDEGMSMMELLMEEGDYFPESFERGDLVEGTLVRKDKNQLILDIGAKQEAVVPSSDLARLPDGYLDGVTVGDTVKGVILRPDGEMVVSVYQAITVKDWEKAADLLESGDILELDVVGFNKGGILVQFGNLQGFVPRSHIVRGQGRDGQAREGVESLVGEVIPVKIIEVSRRKRRLIMSERQALREWRATQKAKLLETLTEGEVRSGTVSSVADFGAFVDLGGADGLVHISEMTYERGRHPRDLVDVGQEVEVYVLSIDRERSRIGLSMKRLQKDPWETVEQDHYVGELVEASISNLTKFGAFARLEDGLEGLIHISELSDEHVEHPREAVRVAQRVTVEIISIDSARQRIGLSIRRVPAHLRTIDEAEPEDEGEPTEDEAAEVEATAAVDSVDESETAAEDEDASDNTEAAVDPDAADDSDDDDSDDDDSDDDDSDDDDSDDDDSDDDDSDDDDSDDDDSDDDDSDDDDSDDDDSDDDDSDDDDSDDDDSDDDSDDDDSDDDDSDDDDSDD